MSDNPNPPAKPPVEPPNNQPPEGQDAITPKPKITENPRDALEIAKLEYLAQRGLPEGADLANELNFVQGISVADDGSITGEAIYRPPASATPAVVTTTESPAELPPAPRNTPAPSGGRGGGPAVSTQEQVDSVVKDIMEERLEAMGYTPRRPADDANKN